MISDMTGLITIIGPIIHGKRKKRKEVEMLPLPVARRRQWLDSFSPIAREFDRFFRTLYEGNIAEDLADYPVDIDEVDNTIIVNAEMPGFKKDDIKVNIDQGVLTITAERKPEEKKGKNHLSERRYKRVDRSFTLPSAVDESGVKAKLKDGVLHMEIPKSGEATPKQIEITN